VFDAHAIQLSERMALTTSIGASTAGHPVMHVVQCRADGKVLRVNTARVVALVTDHQPCGYSSVTYFIRHPMGSVHARHGPYESVPLRVTGTGPLPTVATLINLGPKSGSQRVVIRAAHIVPWWLACTSRNAFIQIALPIRAWLTTNAPACSQLGSA
jgi:hypothetical protein